MNRDKLVIILGAALFLSLAGNFFMAGKMLGGSYEHGMEAGPPADWQKRDEEMRKKLSESDRNILKTSMQQHRPQIQALKEELANARQKVWDAQNAQPFDQAALDAALKDESEKKIAFLHMIRQTREEISTKLSPEGQATFSKLGPGARWGSGGEGGRWGKGEGRWGNRGDGGPERPGRGAWRDRSKPEGGQDAAPGQP
jgi:Spy/CpxP family protein refolding chaperone